MLEADKPTPHESWSAGHVVGAPRATNREFIDEVALTTIAQAELATLSLPHVVIVIDRLIGNTSVLGPFEDAIDAATFAERLTADVGASDGELVITVTGLEPGC